MALTAWPGPRMGCREHIRGCSADTMIHMLEGKQGEQGRAMGYLNAAQLAALLPPCPIVGILELPINVCPIQYMAFCE